MKKSNKLLLVGFIAVLLFITAIHISLYAKYKKGDYTIYNSEDDIAMPVMEPFPNILFVMVGNIPGATVKFNKVAQVEKTEGNNIEYARKGDTLFITGRNSTDQRNASNSVALTVPYNATISVLNSFLFFNGDKKTVENNPVIYLRKSKLFFSGAKNPLQLGNVRIAASDSSTVTFNGNTKVNTLELNLSNSALEYTGGRCENLSIETDSISRISLPSQLLFKAKIRATPLK